MEKEALSAIMLTLLVSLFTVTHVQPAKAEPRTWIVDDDGSAGFYTIQDAIDAANPGDTMILHNSLLLLDSLANFTTSSGVNNSEGVTV